MRGLERAQTRDYMREIEGGKAKQKLCVKPLARCRARNKQSRCWLKDWAAGDILLRICGFLQMLFCVQPFLFITFLSFPQDLLLVSVLLLLSSLNLSEYSHEYLATTSFYKRPLVYPSSLPYNASSFCSLALFCCYSPLLFILLSLYGFTQHFICP